MKRDFRGVASGVGVVVMMAASACGFAQASSAANATEGVAAGQSEQGKDATLEVPAGTVVPLTLVNAIKMKSTPIGGMVRATVAFPVTVGTQLAIPAGVYAEGQLEQATFPKGYKAPKGAPPVSPLKVHFTRLIYPNGYTVSLDAQIAKLGLPLEREVQDEAEQVARVDWPTIGETHGPSNADPYEALTMESPQQQPPPLPPLPQVGPNPGVVIGAVVGVAVVGTTVALLASRHHRDSTDSVAFGPGYPFEMTLSAPLVLDRGRIGKEATVTDSPTTD
jgi:type IV secretion system protein VirB10